MEINNLSSGGIGRRYRYGEFVIRFIQQNLLDIVGSIKRRKSIQVRILTTQQKLMSTLRARVELLGLHTVTTMAKHGSLERQAFLRKYN